MSPGEPSPGRPTLHFTARKGWINDPHGVTFRNGLYHLFYQAVPDAIRWQPWCSWGHATSTDLLHWEQQPPALVPGDGDYGCWSGSLSVAPDTSATMYYTSVTPSDTDRGMVRAARPVDADWLAWQKDKVLVSPPDQPAVTVFRDPNVFRDDGGWRMLVGTGYREGRAAVLSYISDDQNHWQYDGALAESPDAAERLRARRLAWECPQLARIGDRHVLLVSLWADGATQYPVAATGAYSSGRMHIDRWSRLAYGGGHYAPTIFMDHTGDPCVLFWIRNVASRNAGWSGALSIPYRLSLVDDRVRLTPHPALSMAQPDPHQTIGFTWQPRKGASDHLTLATRNGLPVLDLITNNGNLMVATTTATVTAPNDGDEIHVLIDGNVLEVITTAGLIGLPLEHAGPLAAPPPDVRPWWT